MQNSMWKLATLLGVVGVGCLVVMQVQKQLADQETTAKVGSPEGQVASESGPGDDGELMGQSEPATLDQFGEIQDQFEPDDGIRRASFEQSAFGNDDKAAPADAFEPDAFVDFTDEPAASTQKSDRVSADEFFDDDAFADPPGTAAAPRTAAAAPAADAFDSDPDPFDNLGGTPFGTEQTDDRESLTPDPVDDGALWGTENDRPSSTSTAQRGGAPQELPAVEDAFGPGGLDDESAFEDKPSAPGRVNVDINAPKLPGFEDDPGFDDKSLDVLPAADTRISAQEKPGAPRDDPFGTEPFDTDQFGPDQFEADAFDTDKQNPAAVSPATDPMDDGLWGPDDTLESTPAPGTQPDVGVGAAQPEPAPDLDSLPAYRDEAPGLRAVPGARYSEKSFDDVPHGTLKPQLRIEKTAPSSASVGKPLVYSIVLRNVGNAVANSIVVEDQIPQGAKLTGTIPQAELIDGLLVWRFESMKPQEEKTIRIRVIPEREGQIGSVATVNFKAEIGVRTTVTAPKLKLTLDGHREAKVGETVVLRYRVTNTGTGDAQNVWLRNPLPPQLQHPEGDDLEYEVGDLPSGASRDITLQLVAAKAGDIRNSAVVTADGGISAPAEHQLAIIGAQLQVTRRGPARRYIGRNAVYENVVTNTTHRDADESTLIEYVPEGMTFVKASDGGQYNELKRTVAWTVPEVRAGESVSFKVQLAPSKTGEHESVVQIVEKAGFKARANSVTQIMHLNNMGLQLSELDGPVSVGEKIVFTINIRNRGTSTATGAVLSLSVPSELRVTEAGPMMARQNGDIVEFDPVEKIAPGESRQYQIAFVAQRAATDIRLRASIQSDQMPRHLSTEESITVYEDNP